jgi:hypothetical protein
MIPIGYMAKSSCKKPEGLVLPQVDLIYSVSSCVNDNFADYVGYWKHNGFWHFNNPEIIQELAHANAINLEGATLFYYEAHDLESDGKVWRRFVPWNEYPVDVAQPVQKQLEDSMSSPSGQRTHLTRNTRRSPATG